MQLHYSFTQKKEKHSHTIAILFYFYHVGRWMVDRIIWWSKIINKKHNNYMMSITICTCFHQSLTLCSWPFQSPFWHSMVDLKTFSSNFVSKLLVLSFTWWLLSSSYLLPVCLIWNKWKIRRQTKLDILDCPTIQ